MMGSRSRPLAFGSALLLLLGLGAVVVGYLLAGESDALLAGGVVSTARVVDRKQSGTGTSKAYLLFFETTPAAAGRLRVRTSQETFDATAIGSQVTVTYLPGHESVVVLGDMAEVRAIQSRSTYAQWFGGASAVIGLLLGAVALVRPRATP